MSDVQVFEGDGQNPDGDFVSIPFGGFSVHADRKGRITYHVFPHKIPHDGIDVASAVKRNEFLRRTELGDEVLCRLEWGALAMRRHLNHVQMRSGMGHDLQDVHRWTVEEKMNARNL